MSKADKKQIPSNLEKLECRREVLNFVYRNIMGLEEGDKILEKAREFVVSQKAREKVYKDLSERDSIAKYLGEKDPRDFNDGDRILMAEIALTEKALDEINQDVIEANLSKDDEKVAKRSRTVLSAVRKALNFNKKYSRDDGDYFNLVGRLSKKYAKIDEELSSLIDKTQLFDMVNSPKQLEDLLKENGLVSEDGFSKEKQVCLRAFLFKEIGIRFPDFLTEEEKEGLKEFDKITGEDLEKKGEAFLDAIKRFVKDEKFKSSSDFIYFITIVRDALEEWHDKDLKEVLDEFIKDCPSEKDQQQIPEQEQQQKEKEVNDAFSVFVAPPASVEATMHSFDKKLLQKKTSFEDTTSVFVAPPASVEAIMHSLDGELSKKKTSFEDAKDELRSLLPLIEDVNISSKNGNTPLLFAVSFDDEASVKDLILKGAEITKSVLIAAVSGRGANSGKIIDELLPKNDLKIDDLKDAALKAIDCGKVPAKNQNQNQNQKQQSFLEKILDSAFGKICELGGSERQKFFEELKDKNKARPESSKDSKKSTEKYLNIFSGQVAEFSKNQKAESKKVSSKKLVEPKTYEELEVKNVVDDSETVKNVNDSEAGQQAVKTALEEIIEQVETKEAVKTALEGIIVQVETKEAVKTALEEIIVQVETKEAVKTALEEIIEQVETKVFLEEYRERRAEAAKKLENSGDRDYAYYTEGLIEPKLPESSLPSDLNPKAKAFVPSATTSTTEAKAVAGKKVETNSPPK